MEPKLIILILIKIIFEIYNPNLKFSDETIYETPTLIGIIRDEISKDKMGAISGGLPGGLPGF